MFTEARAYEAINTTQQITHLIFCWGSCVFISAVVEGKQQDGTLNKSAFVGTEESYENTQCVVWNCAALMTVAFIWRLSLCFSWDIFHTSGTLGKQTRTMLQTSLTLQRSEPWSVLIYVLGNDPSRRAPDSELMTAPRSLSSSGPLELWGLPCCWRLQTFNRTHVAQKIIFPLYFLIFSYMTTSFHMESWTPSKEI